MEMLNFKGKAKAILMKKKNDDNTHVQAQHLSQLQYVVQTNGTNYPETGLFKTHTSLMANLTVLGNSGISYKLCWIATSKQIIN